MDLSELELIRRLKYGAISETELEDIFYRFKDSYRIHFHLVQHPRFPQKLSLGIVPKLFVMDLLKVVKNKRTNPFVRKRVELEFTLRYHKLAAGEKISLLKMAPASLLQYFSEEKDKKILEAIFRNPNCTEELVLRFVNRRGGRFALYEVLAETEWYKRPAVAYAVSRDPEAPIRLLILIIPYVGLNRLKELYEDDDTHIIVRKNIVYYLESRRNK